MAMRFHLKVNCILAISHFIIFILTQKPPLSDTMCHLYPVIYYTVQVDFHSAQPEWICEKQKLCSKTHPNSGSLTLLTYIGDSQPCSDALLAREGGKGAALISFESGWIPHGYACCPSSRSSYIKRRNSPKNSFFKSVSSPLTIAAFPDLYKSQGGGRSQCASEQYTVAGNLLGELPVIVCLVLVCNLFVNSVAVLLFVVFC